jgi:beta-lactamase superfamily II metal-dependent hydrolase
MAAAFEFCFVEMGQGDCCIVRCPDKKIVVVDCGSTANRYGNENAISEGREQLRAWAAENRNTVDALILTHSDADHYNKVLTFFLWKEETVGGRLMLKRAPIFIDRIFFSNAKPAGKTGAGPLGNYTSAAVNKNVYNHLFSTDSIHEVNINSSTDSNNHVKTWRKGDGTAKSFATMDDPVTPVTDKRHRVLGTTEDWKVEIIAGNVPRLARDAATEENAKSLITLFTVGTKKVLLCGDATFSTEAFLLAVHGATIAGVDLVQIPHHGSDYASGQQFIDKVDPKAAVVSVNFMEHSFRLPRHDKVLGPWMTRITANGETLPMHDVDYWVGPRPIEEILAKQQEWTAAGKELMPHTGTRFAALAQPEKNTEIGLYRQLNDGMFLFRKEVQTHLTQTSQNTQIYRLTSAGLEYVDAAADDDAADTEDVDDGVDVDADEGMGVP